MNFVAAQIEQKILQPTPDVRELPNALLHWGKSPVSYMAHKSGLHKFGSDERGCLYYTPFQNWNFVLGDPVAGERDAAELLRAFCAERNNVVFVQISKSIADVLEGIGLPTSRFGVETRLKLPFDLSGNNRSDIRLLYNRGTAAGINVVEYQTDDLYRLYDKLAVRGFLSKPRYRRGLEFLARSDHDHNDPRIRWFVGQIDDLPVGMSIFYPVFDRGQAVEYAEILPVRFNTAPKGTRVKILLDASIQLKHEGVASINLGLSPFKIPHTGGAPLNRTEKLLDKLFRFGVGAHNFKGLAFHKSRYRGEETVVYWATSSRFPVWPLAKLYRLSTGSWLPAALLRIIP